MVWFNYWPWTDRLTMFPGPLALESALLSGTTIGDTNTFLTQITPSHNTSHSAHHSIIEEQL